MHIKLPVIDFDFIYTIAGSPMVAYGVSVGRLGQIFVHCQQFNLETNITFNLSFWEKNIGPITEWVERDIDFEWGDEVEDDMGNTGKMEIVGYDGRWHIGKLSYMEYNPRKKESLGFVK